jgi:hypothetical protein
MKETEGCAALYSEGVGYESAGSTLSSEEFIPSDGIGRAERGRRLPGADARVGRTITGGEGSTPVRRIAYAAGGRLIESFVVRDDSFVSANTVAALSPVVLDCDDPDTRIPYCLSLAGPPPGTTQSKAPATVPGSPEVPPFELDFTPTWARRPVKSYKVRVTRVAARATGLMLPPEAFQAILLEGENDE